MTVYYAMAEVPNDSSKYLIRAFWDKHNGYGVSVIESNGISSIDSVDYVGTKEAALLKFTTKVRRIIKDVYNLK